MPTLAPTSPSLSTPQTTQIPTPTDETLAYANPQDELPTVHATFTTAPSQPSASPPPPTDTHPMPGLSDTQSKYSRVKRRKLMDPTGPALAHPAASMLKTFADHGCPAQVTQSFTLEQLEHAIQRGAHPSARSARAAAALHLEVKEKIAQGYARLIPWEHLKKSLPQSIRISPIAAIPHKSRDFRMILDLSYMFTIDGTPWQSVNDASNPQEAPMNSMSQLGHVLPRLIHAIATSPEEQGPWLFMKLDIKDGFWRMVVPEKDEFNFCYVLPQTHEDDPIQIVVPSSLQMGWTFSPPYFCAATETARDVAATLAHEPTLPPHPFEAATMTEEDAIKLHRLACPSTWSSTTLPEYRDALTALLECYVDDFVGALQSTNPKDLLHHSRALLHAIHSIFPPSPNPDIDPDDEPVSLKKLHAGEGAWAFRKEILGWIFDGIHRTIELPPGKLSKIRTAIKQVLHRQGAPLREFQSVLGKLQHACLAIPNGKGLLSPLYNLLPPDTATRAPRRWIPVPKDSSAYMALKDLRTVLKLVANRPTKCSQLVPGWPDYVGFCDACKYGAGGVWLSGKSDLHPVIWRVAWPPDIVARLISRDNPDGDLTINDLEMAGLLLHYLVLEQLLPDMAGKHAAAWCDNTSTVSWARRQSCKRSRVGQRLLRALSIRHVATKSSPLAPWSIAGANNQMADLASRSFRKGGKGNFELTDTALLTKFNSLFPLTQEASWHLHHLNNNISSLVFSELRQQQQPMGSWLRLPKPASTSGLSGNNSSPSLATTTPTSPNSPRNNGLTLSKPMPIGYAMDMPDEKIALALSEFNKRWQPSPRPTNWLSNPAPRTKTKRVNPTGQP